MSKIDNHLWIGTVYNAHDKDFLEKHGITHVLSCAKEFDKPSFPVVHHQLEITDDKADCKTREQFIEGAATIDKWIQGNHTIIVHCHAGVSRSVSVVMAYYILYRGYSYDKAFSILKRKRPKMNIYRPYIPILRSFVKRGKTKTRKASASRIIIFNPTRTHYLVGKESYFIKNKPGLSEDTKKQLETLFTRKVNNAKPKESNNPEEIAYYGRQVDKIKGVVKGRITFGDIRYTRVGAQWYSYTIPQYVPDGTPFSFPGGQPKSTNTNISCAKRELFEETGIRCTSLIDIDRSRAHYKLLYYVPDENEYKQFLLDIHAKNKNPYAELHSLQFIPIQSPKVSDTALRNYRALTRRARQ